MNEVTKIEASGLARVDILSSISNVVAAMRESFAGEKQRAAYFCAGRMSNDGVFAGASRFSISLEQLSSVIDNTLTAHDESLASYGLADATYPAAYKAFLEGLLEKASFENKEALRPAIEQRIEAAVELSAASVIQELSWHANDDTSVVASVQGSHLTQISPVQHANTEYLSRVPTISTPDGSDFTAEFKRWRAERLQTLNIASKEELALLATPALIVNAQGTEQDRIASGKGNSIE